MRTKLKGVRASRDIWFVMKPAEQQPKQADAEDCEKCFNCEYPDCKWPHWLPNAECPAKNEPQERKYHKWTRDEDAEIIRLHETGFNRPQIAARFGCHWTSVATRMKILKRKGLL